MMEFSIDQQIEEVERELRLRDGVYKRQVAAGKMRDSIAAYHTDRMRAVLATLQEVKAERQAKRSRCREG